MKNELEVVIAPWIAENAVNERIRADDGVMLNTYYCLHPGAESAVVMVHGFCEFFGKYHEMFWRFYQAGYSVFFIELRGYGKSGNTRNYEDHRVTIGSFSEYVSDLRCFMEKSVTVHAPDRKYVLYAHSMGGAVGALYLEEYPRDFVCAVLSSPMMEIDFGRIPPIAVGVAQAVSSASYRDDEYAPGQHAWSGKYAFEDSSSTSRKRYDYQFRQRMADPSYQTWGGTWAWVRAARRGYRRAVRNAGKIEVPVLLFQAEHDSLVTPEGQEMFCRRSRCTVIVRMPGTKHEIYSSDDALLDLYMKNILVFLKAYTGRRNAEKKRKVIFSGNKADRITEIFKKVLQKR